MKVLKFGGTSVGSPEKLKKLVEFIDPAATQIVVLSAVAGTTNALVEIAGLAKTHQRADAAVRTGSLHQEYLRFVDALLPQGQWAVQGQALVDHWFGEIDSLTALPFSDEEEKRILAVGETLSTGLFHLHLQSIGLRSVLLSALDFMYTDADGEPDEPRIVAGLKAALAAHPHDGLFITQGYICRNHRGGVDNLQRGGSDYTATLIGAAIGAEEVEIWTDVSGIHTADPGLVKGTRTLPGLSYAEAAELARFGAEVLHPRCVEPAQRAGIPVRVLNTLQPAAGGTLVSDQSRDRGVKSIAVKKDITVLTVTNNRNVDDDDFQDEVLSIANGLGLRPLMRSQSDGAITLRMAHTAALPDAFKALEALGEVGTVQDESIICLVGNFGAITGQYNYKVLVALGRITLRSFAHGEGGISILLAIAQHETPEALAALHGAFFTPAPVLQPQYC